MTRIYLRARELSLGILGWRDETARDVHPLTRPTREPVCWHLAPQLFQLFSQELHLRTCRVPSVEQYRRTAMITSKRTREQNINRHLAFGAGCATLRPPTSGRRVHKDAHSGRAPPATSLHTLPCGSQQEPRPHPWFVAMLLRLPFAMYSRKPTVAHHRPYILRRKHCCCTKLGIIFGVGDGEEERSARGML